MKPIVKIFKPCLAAALLMGLGTSDATIVTVSVEIGQGFMDVYENVSGTQGAGVFNSPWGFADVKSTPGSSSIKLEPNYNTYGDPAVATGNTFWRDNGGAGPGGNKWMIASSFADKSAAFFPDGICNFKAKVDAYSFTAGYTVRAFVKGFDEFDTFITAVFSPPLVLNSDVDLVYDFAAVLIAEGVPVGRVQYGFEVQGLNANSAFPQGSATVIANVVVPVTPGVPFAGFEQGDTGWKFDQANNHLINYETAGGNPGGFAKIDSTGASLPYFAVLVSNERNPLSLEALSLTAGQTYTFAMDMKIFDNGPNIGGFKVDFIPGDPGNPNSPTHTTGDMFPTPSSTPGEWSTYSFSVPIPANAIGLKLVPLWGVGSVVGYDNVRVAGPFAASATVVGPNVEISWPTAKVPNNTPALRTYQVMKSNNLMNWAPFGGVTNGNGSTFTVTDPIGAPGKSFFQVIETRP